MARELSSSERKHLRGLAHGLKPVVMIGKKGITEELIKSMEQALEANELIKVKFLEFKEDKEELSHQIEEKTRSNMVGLIGHVAIFYRENPDPKKRKIEL